MDPLARCVAAALCLAACCQPAVAGVPEAPAPAETAAQRDRRMAWWREARFGLFIHWGLYAIPAGEWKGQTVGGTGEWILHGAQIPVADYEPLLNQFNPVQFDARAWVRVAKAAGMKYIVITSKHHDGFCLFDAHNSDFTVAHTPFRRDILKELAAACKEGGIRLCFYHSIMDWHHPDYLPRRPWDARPTEGADLDRYVDYMKAQLKQLATEYGPIGVMWFDGEWEGTWDHARGLDLYSYVRGLRPGIIVNNRVDKGRQGMAGMNSGPGFAGDFGTPEQEVPASGLPGVDWESCITMNDTWGYKRSDTNWKSGPDLVRMLVDIASKGGNLLLNVGPTAEGVIPEASVERLAFIGQWMRRNAESIHGTTASPIGRPAWGRATARPGKLYLHVFDWPTDGLLALPDVRAASARLLATGARLAVANDASGATVSLPAAAPDRVDSVVALTLAR